VRQKKTGWGRTSSRLSSKDLVSKNFEPLARLVDRKCSKSVNLWVVPSPCAFVVLQIVELILDNCYSTNVVGLTDEFVNLERLSLIKVGLTNLKNFPNLPNLTRVSKIFWRAYLFLLHVFAPYQGYFESSLRVCSSFRYSVFVPVYFQLELGENRITSGLQSLQGSPKLAHLSLSNNRIKDLETLEPLVSTNVLSNRLRMRRGPSIDQLLNLTKELSASFCYFCVCGWLFPSSSNVFWCFFLR